MSDLKGRARHAGMLAKILMFIYVIVYGPYCERETYLMWAQLVYEIAWYYVYPKLRFEKPPKIMWAIMVNNISTMKCNFKLAIRAILEPVFGLLRPAMTRADIDHNLDILRYIYPLRFHCTDPWARRGHFLGIIIPRALSAGLFFGDSTPGVLFHDYLDPIPDVTLAFVLTNIQFCLSEWMTPTAQGIHTPRKLSEVGQKGMRSMFLSHMENICLYRTKANSRLDRLGIDWFKYAIVYSGASIDDDDDDNLQNIFDVNEFQESTPEPEIPRPEPGPSHRRSQHCAPRPDRADSGAGPSVERARHDNLATAHDHQIAMSWQRAEYEDAGEDIPMDLDYEKGSDYEFPDPPPPSSPPPPPEAPPELDGDCRYTSASKGKHRQ
ncbi:hypothetical protein FRC12_022988 [Ceratobasidium sp. 428]|nr:hypothetical protein FRC12_022988 [Ceratobasidium sp. 428]